jgi:hypothetical protein
MRQFLNNRIGDKVVPVDNSQQFNIATGAPSSLAGTHREEPRLVTIVSEPYKLSYFMFDQIYTEEFVTVRCDGETFVCLNNFYDSYEMAMEAHSYFMRGDQN